MLSADIDEVQFREAVDGNHLVAQRVGWVSISIMETVQGPSVWEGKGGHGEVSQDLPAHVKPLVQRSHRLV